MNKIDFISIRGKNFRCYKEFELKFDSNKLIAIIGKNGKGKSTYLMAITALLYGETPKGEKIPSLVNNKVGKNLELIGDFRINTDNYTIERYYKHYQMKDALIIKKNGVDISKESTPETYKFISSLLVSKDVFMNSVYFSQQVKDFFTALTDSKQKDIFNAILDLKDYEIDYNKAKDSADNISEKIESLKEQRMMKKNEFDAAQLRLHYEMNDIKNKLQERKNKVESLNKTKETNIQEIEDINKQKSFIEYDESKHQELIKYISISQVVIGNIENEFKTFSNLKQTELETYINNLNQSHQLRILEEKNNVEEEFSKYKKQQEPKISELSQKKIDLVNQIHSKREKEDLVFYEGIRNIDNQIFEYQSKIKELQEESKCKDLNSEMEKEISNINNRISELEKTKNDFQKEVLKLKDDKEKSVELVKVLSNNLSKQFPICSLCKQEIKSKEARNNVEDEVKRLNLVIKECDIHIEEIKNKFQPIKDEYKKLNDDIDQIKIKYDNLINSKISNALEEIKKISTKKLQFERQKKINEDKHNQNLIDFDNEIVKSTKFLTDEINSITDKINCFKSDLDLRLKVFIKHSDEEIQKESNNKIIEIKNCIESKREEINIKIENIKEENTKINTIIALFNQSKKQIDSYNLRISILESENKNLDSEIEMILNVKDDPTSIKKCEQDIENISNEQNKLQGMYEELSERLEITEFWKVGFSDKGIPSMLIDSAIPFMNVTVKQILETISPGKYVVSFDTQSQLKSGDIREKFCVNILNTDTGANSHLQLSGGEQRQVDVAIMRTLRLLAENFYQKRFNITLLDEVLDSLDTENSSQFCRYLKQIVKDQTIILVTHNVLTNCEADDVLRL